VLAAAVVAPVAFAAPDYAMTGGASPTPEPKRSAKASSVKLPKILKKIAECESGSDPKAVSDNGKYRGKFQFHRSTWRAVGGKGDPAKASESEQDKRALRLYRAEGTSPWPVCGKR
jgi:hypothetical protein